MSFIKRAQEAAAAAAEQAQQAAGLATRQASDPATQEKLGQQARAAMGAARRGVSTVVERIDPGVLADLIIKSTALQEMTNASLREKKSPTGSPRSTSPPRSRPASRSPSAGWTTWTWS